MNKIDDKSIAEFIDYYKDTVIPNPEHYPKQFEFMLKAFLHSKKMQELND
jgi:hypothetical protein